MSRHIVLFSVVTAFLSPQANAYIPMPFVMGLCQTGCISRPPSKPGKYAPTISFELDGQPVNATDETKNITTSWDCSSDQIELDITVTDPDYEADLDVDASTNLGEPIQVQWEQTEADGFTGNYRSVNHVLIPTDLVCDAAKTDPRNINLVIEARDGYNDNSHTTVVNVLVELLSNQ